MTRTELIIQLLKVAIGLAFGAYFVWWSLQVLDRLTPEYAAPTAVVARALTPANSIILHSAGGKSNAIRSIERPRVHHAARRRATRAQQRAMPLVAFLSGVSPSFLGRRRVRRGRRGLDSAGKRTGRLRHAERPGCTDCRGASHPVHRPRVVSGSTAARRQAKTRM
jgi:hypothetical protein